MAEYYFSPYQIAEMAMGVEEEGARFYQELAGSVDNGRLKGIFANLARAELKHRETFRTIADTLHKEDLNEYSVDVAGLMRAYLERLKATAFKARPSTENPSIILEALAIAIHTEEEAISIYAEMRRVFIDKFREVLTAIIEEERKHLDILTGIRL
jgi:rubrerythrin